MKNIISYIIEKQQTGSEKPEMVDLGLSVKWAKYNIGADGGSTKESWYGDFYAWGETKTKSNYTWKNYAHCTEGYDLYKGEGFLTKYNDSDGKKVLKSVDDVATKTYGSSYRIPTKAELEELFSLPSKWVTDYNDISGLNGRVFTGTNGNILFVPAAGDFVGTSHRSAGSYCHLWSSSLDLENPDSAWDIYFNSDSIHISEYGRCGGLPVRCVSKK